MLPPPPPHTLPHIGTGIDTRILELEPDEQWKADLRKRIERNLCHLVEDTRRKRNIILNSRPFPSEDSRQRAQRDYEESMHNIRMLAQKDFNYLLHQEMSEREWILNAVHSNSLDVAWQQQWTLDNIRKANVGHPPFPPTDAPQNAKREYGEGEYNMGPVQFPRRGGPNSTGPTSNSAGPHHHAGYINPDQYHASSVAPHDGTKHPPPQNHDRLASKISAPWLQQTSALAGLHDRPSQPTYPTVLRAIPGAQPPLDKGVRFQIPKGSGLGPINSMQQSPEEMGQGGIPREPNIPKEGLRGTPWGPFNSRHPFNEFNPKDEQRLTPIEEEKPSDVLDDFVGHLDDRQSIRGIHGVHNTMSVEQLTASWETEAKRKEEEARRLEEGARQFFEEARCLKACARQAEGSTKTREEEAKKRGAEAQKRKLEAQRKEDAQDRELEAWRKEEKARRKEEQAQRMKENVHLREILAQQKEKEARRLQKRARKSWVEAKSIAEDYERKKREIEQKEAELKNILCKEQEAHQAKENPQFGFKELARDDEDTTRLKVEETARVDASNRAIREAQSREKQSRANGRKGSQAQMKQQEKVLEEQRRQKMLEEGQRHREQWLLEERRKQEALKREAERIRLFNEELSPEEQARLDHEHRLAKAQESEADRIRYAVEDEWHGPYGVLAEQRRQRDEQRHHQQQQQDETFRQRAKEERQQEFQRPEPQYYQRPLERERQNNMSTLPESRATPYQSGSTTGSTGVRSDISIAASSTLSSRLPPMSSSHVMNSLPVFTSQRVPDRVLREHRWEGR